MTAKEIVEENFGGLDELINDSDLTLFYKQLIITCMEEYSRKKTEDEVKELKEQINWLRKFIWEDSVNLKHDIQKVTPPFRIGKKQKRAILDANGHEVGIFVTGYENMAQIFCDFLNTKQQVKTEIEKL